MDKETKVAEQLAPSIQDIVINELVKDNNVSFQDVLKSVKSHYPKSKFSKACFYWYRRRTNAEGITTPKINHPASKR